VKKNISLPVFIERWSSNFWVVPTITSLIIIALMPLMLSIDKKFFSNTFSENFFTGYSADAARLILSSICTSVMTVIGVLFSITIVVVQQASSQYSPRVVEIFIKARNSQFVLGLYVGTFVYCILLLRQVPTPEPGSTPEIPQSAVTLGIILALLCIGFLVQYVHFITHSIRSTRIIETITKEATKFLKEYENFKRTHSSPTGDTPLLPFSKEVISKKTGYFQSYLPDKIEEINKNFRHQITFHHHVGDFQLKGMSFCRIESERPLSDKELDKFREAINIGPERTHAQDVRYSVRQLVDMALRALSPSVNDPTTAIEALNGILIILNKWLESPRTSNTLSLQNGVKVIIQQDSFGTVAEFSFSQIIIAARSHYMVMGRIIEILNLLKEKGDDDQKKTISEYVEYVQQHYLEEKPVYLMKMKEFQGLTAH